RLQRLDLRRDLREEVGLVDAAAVAVLRVEDVAVLALAPQDALHELEDLVGLADVVARLDHFEGEQAAAAHAEADRTDAPVVHRVDLGADLPTGGGPDVHDPLAAADLLGGHAEDLRPAVELVHEGQDLVLLAGDHAAHALGGPHYEHVPDVPGEVVVEVVELVDGE